VTTSKLIILLNIKNKRSPSLGTFNYRDNSGFTAEKGVTLKVFADSAGEAAYCHLKKGKVLSGPVFPFQPEKVYWAVIVFFNHLPINGFCRIYKESQA
jgi:hypothetical protein